MDEVHGDHDLVPFARRFPPEIHYQILSHLEAIDVRTFSWASWAFHDIALPFIWRNVEFGQSNTSTLYLAKFFRFMIQHPRYAAAVRCLSVKWAADPLSVDLSDGSAHDAASEIVETFNRAGVLFNQLKCLRFAYANDRFRDGSIPLPIPLITTFFRAFGASPIRILLIRSIDGISPPLLQTCAMWSATLTHLMVDVYNKDNFVSQASIALQAPIFPQLRLLATRDLGILSDVVINNPPVEAVHLLGNPPGAQYWANAASIVNTMGTILSLRDKHAPPLNSKLRSLTLIFRSNQDRGLADVVRAIFLPALEDLTLHMGCEDFLPLRNNGMAELAVEELSKAYGFLPSSLPMMAKLCLRLQNIRAHLPTYQPSPAHSRYNAKASSLLIDLLHEHSLRPSRDIIRLRDIEIWCQGSGVEARVALCILQASIPAQDGWIVEEMIKGFTRLGWRAILGTHTIPDCFEFPLEPLSVLEEQWEAM
ncbi:hypothetical protein DL93DRAFT_2101030 [Clavulina sp. PMI_390]|nr:hypothetical protein DL93DRAFT_2101030 [Clavulina sp. PMI_390]